MKTTEHIGKISLDNRKRTNLVQNYFLVLRSYQVEHKAGVLSIMATKDKADVDVKSDTIRLLVKPGDRQVPAAKVPEVKTVHVEANLPRIYALWRGPGILLYFFINTQFAIPTKQKDWWKRRMEIKQHLHHALHVSRETCYLCV